MEEKSEVVANCDHLAGLKFSKALPYAFTEHGSIMAASVLSTPRAIEVSLFIVRAFVKLRRTIQDQKEFQHKIANIERRLTDHDEQFRVVFEAIKALMKEEEKPKRGIGFQVEEPKAIYKVKRRSHFSN